MYPMTPPPPPGTLAPPPPDDLRDAVRLLDLAWGVIANADGWDDDTSWRQAAKRWRDQYHRLLAVLPEPPVPPWPGDENDDTARLSPDQGDRIVNACCRMLGCEPADIDGDAALEEILTEAVERCADLHGQDRWEDDCHGCGFRVGDHTTDGRCPAPAAPVPPWPGAVLSGLTDEDGEPTWLAQAPNVLGEAVRTCVDFPWFICGSDNAVTPYWVEVRGGQVAVAVEPETERVPWYSVVADQRRLVGFPKVGGTRYGADGCLAFTDHDGVLLANVHDPAIGWDGSGTVEVLKDGGQ